LVGDNKKVFEVSYTHIHEALRTLVKRAIKSGDIREDLDSGPGGQVGWPVRANCVRRAITQRNRFKPRNPRRFHALTGLESRLFEGGTK
jgi:hypothetical protein